MADVLADRLQQSRDSRKPHPAREPLGHPPRSSSNQEIVESTRLAKEKGEAEGERISAAIKR